MDNKKGYIRGNVVWSCFNCNVKNRMEHRGLLLNRFEKNKTYTYQEIRKILFNPGYTFTFHNSLKVDKQTKRELDKKVNVHRVKGDIVSAHANKETAFGNLFAYKHGDKES